MVWQKTHGLSTTKEYHAWAAMVQRCHNPKYHGYARYGGRGIAVCDEWRGSFEAFYEYIGPSPSSNHSVDRIDNGRGYEPGNVRWATWKEQQNNRSSNHVVEWQGVSKNVTQWSEDLGIPAYVLIQRLARRLPLEQVFHVGRLTANSSRGSSHHRSKLTEDQAREIRRKYNDGQHVSDIAKEYGVGHNCIRAAVSGKTWAHLDIPPCKPRPEKRRRGEENRRSLLTEETVREIRAKYAAGGHSAASLGRKFGVSTSTIQFVVNGTTWKHVK